jgi:DNA polymerase-3 subunit epsilon
MRKLKLKKPLCFFDLETTGTDTMKSKIVSISIKKIFPSGIVDHFSTLVNPGIPIPKEVSEIHGITDEMVKDYPLFETLADRIYTLFLGSDIAGYNSDKFDIPLLSTEFAAVNLSFPEEGFKSIDVFSIFSQFQPRTLSAAYKLYVGGELNNAHDSQADTEATFLILNEMLKAHSELPDNMDELSIFSLRGNERVDICGKFGKDKDGDYIFNFGKHQGSKINYNNVEYLGWMINKGEFHSDTINWAKKIHSNIINSKK